MATIYEDIIPPIIENTTMYKVVSNGVHRATRIKPYGGYVLRDNLLDSTKIDEASPDIVNKIAGYYRGERSVSADYDFDKNERGFSAVLTHLAEGEIF